jgi:hypothetical protein
VRDIVTTVDLVDDVGPERLGDLAVVVVLKPLVAVLPPSAAMSSATRVILRGLMMGILAAAIAFVVSDWSKPRVVIVMGSLGAVRSLRS